VFRFAEASCAIESPAAAEMARQTPASDLDGENPSFACYAGDGRRSSI
jgi:hypothetical protein